MSDATVGVVIPAFCAASTLDAALASIAAQSRPAEAVVVVDDASNDDTAAVAKRWCDLLPLDVLVLATNGGPAAARRAGIATLGTERIALLDSDDMLFPDHLQVLADVAGEPGRIASGDGVRWRPGSGIHQRTYRQNLPVPPPHEQRKAILRRNFVFVGSMFWREDYLRAGGFRDGVSGAEDWELWIRMVLNGVVVKPAAGPSYLYRLSSDGLTANDDIRATYCRVLERIWTELPGLPEQQEVAEALGWHRARAALGAAHAAARNGDRTAARAMLREPGRRGGVLGIELALARLSPVLEARLSASLRRRKW